MENNIPDANESSSQWPTNHSCQPAVNLLSRRLRVSQFASDWFYCQPVACWSNIHLHSYLTYDEAELGFDILMAELRVSYPRQEEIEKRDREGRNALHYLFALEKHGLTPRISGWMEVTGIKAETLRKRIQMIWAETVWAIYCNRDEHANATLPEQFWFDDRRRGAHCREFSADRSKMRRASIAWANQIYGYDEIKFKGCLS